MNPHRKHVLDAISDLIGTRDERNEDIILYFTQGVYGERYETPHLVPDQLKFAPRYDTDAQITESITFILGGLARRAYNADLHEQVIVHYVGLPCRDPIPPDTLQYRDDLVRYGTLFGWQFEVLTFDRHEPADCAYSVGFPYTPPIAHTPAPLLSGIPPVLLEPEQDVG